MIIVKASIHMFQLAPFNDFNSLTQVVWKLQP